MITEMDKILSNCRKFLDSNNSKKILLEKINGKVSDLEFKKVQSDISSVSAFDIAEILGVAFCDKNILERIVNAKDIGYQTPSDFVYKMALKNSVCQIKLDSSLKSKISRMRSEKRINEIKSLIANHNVFDFSQILAIAFMKSSEVIVMDLINTEIPVLDTEFL